MKITCVIFKYLNAFTILDMKQTVVISDTFS